MNESGGDTDDFWLNQGFPEDPDDEISSIATSYFSDDETIIGEMDLSEYVERDKVYSTYTFDIGMPHPNERFNDSDGYCKDTGTSSKNNIMSLDDADLLLSLTSHYLQEEVDQHVDDTSPLQTSLPINKKVAKKLSKGTEDCSVNRKRAKVPLTAAALLFKKNMFSIFTVKKCFSKDKIKILHDGVAESLGLENISRCELRSINLYYNHYAPYADKILSEICKNFQKFASLIEK